jgi:hypothetical protein
MVNKTGLGACVRACVCVCVCVCVRVRVRVCRRYKSCTAAGYRTTVPGSWNSFKSRFTQRPILSYRLRRDYCLSRGCRCHGSRAPCPVVFEQRDTANVRLACPFDPSCPCKAATSPSFNDVITPSSFNSFHAKMVVMD